MVQLNEEILHKVITKRPEISHKGTFGRVALIGGNQQYGGAIIMSAEACIKSGAGLTTVITAEKITPRFILGYLKRWCWTFLS